MSNNALKYTDPSGHLQYKDPYTKRTPPPPPAFLPLISKSIPPVVAPGSASDNSSSSEPYATISPEFYEYWEESPPIPITVGMEYKFDLREVEWLKLVTNGAGVIADFATLLVGVGFVEAAPIAGWGTVVDFAGLLVEVNDAFAENNYSDLTIDTVQLIAEETSALRILPIWGFSKNVIGVAEALESGITKVYLTYTPPKNPPFIGPLK